MQNREMKALRVLGRGTARLRVPLGNGSAMTASRETSLTNAKPNVVFAGSTEQTPKAMVFGWYRNGDAHNAIKCMCQLTECML